MPKHHKEENENLELIESPEALISLIIKNKEDKDWALNEIMHGGPVHKQAYSALLLTRMQ